MILLTTTEQTIQEYADRVAELYKENLGKSKRIATGDLINSVKTEVRFGDLHYEVWMNLAEHWKFVEYDTRPHWAPKGCLLQWIAAKGLPVHSQKGDRLPTPMQLDFLIRRKIAEVGTKGSHDLSKTLDELNEEYTRKITTALNDDLAREVTVILRKLVD